MTWPTFWVDQTDEVELSLRRYARDQEQPCPGGYHNVSVDIGRAAPALITDDGHIDMDAIAPSNYAGDARWPTHCRCGYEFKAEDEWQVNQERIYRERGGAREWGQRDLPVGAVFDSWWMPDNWKHADGRAITVVLPDLRERDEHYVYDARGAFWNVDGPASHQEPDPTPENPERKKTVLVPHAWTRQGDPDDLPNFSVTPSINAEGNNYHSYWTAGVLGDPL